MDLVGSGAPKIGKTTGMPPRTGLLPSRAALEDTKRRSAGVEELASGAFQEITVAPIVDQTPWTYTCAIVQISYRREEFLQRRPMALLMTIAH